MSTPSSLAALRARLAAVATPAGRHGAVTFGDPAVDAHLPPGGLALGTLHEVAAEGLEAETGALTAAFAAVLLARLLARPGEARPAIWIARAADLYPPGLAAYGIDPARLLLVQSGGDALTLAAAEAALRDGAAAVVVAETGAFPRLAGRRLRLAAEARGSIGLVLRRWPYGRRPTETADGTAAATRWRLAPAPSRPEGREPGRPCWQVALVQARGGRPGGWVMALDGEEDGDAPHALRVVAALADASGRTPQRRRA